MNELVVRVRCNGNVHKVALRGDRVRLLDHSGSGARTATEIGILLGGPKVKCFTVLDAWRHACAGRPDGRLPVRLLEEATKRYEEKRIARGKNWDRIEFYHYSFLEQTRRNALARAGRAFRSSRGYYRVDRYLNCIEEDQVERGLGGVIRPEVCGDVRVANGTAIATLAPIRWHRRVFMRGLALADEVFVLDAPPIAARQPHLPEGFLRVLAARQSSRTLRPEFAIVRPGVKGKWRLEWEKK